jgi:hypothetical protein
MEEGGWTDAVRGVALVLQAVAVVVAGAAAYYKWLRGRTFAARAELTVTGSLLSEGRHRALQVKATFRNKGASPIRLRAKGVLAFRLLPDAWEEKGGLSWQAAGSGYVFPGHTALEPQETISDEVLVPVQDDDVAGGSPDVYRVECRVYSDQSKGAFTRWWRTVTHRRRENHEGGGKWVAQAIIPAKLQSSGNAAPTADGAGPAPEMTEEGG